METKGLLLVRARAVYSRLQDCSYRTGPACRASSAVAVAADGAGGCLRAYSRRVHRQATVRHAAFKARRAAAWRKTRIGIPNT